MRRRLLRTRRSSSRSFTLLEMLVAVGAVALMSVGIAQIFRATGETVRIGRRISRLNEYAGLLERQMRSDFDAMTREGFLVIRNQMANGQHSNGRDANCVKLFRDQPASASLPRRVDEIVFFAHGDFTSKRDAIHSQRVARASSARIYYGHGWKDDPAFQQGYLSNGNAPLSYAVSAASDFGRPPTAGGTGPNEYAKDWNLMRHVTLLMQPGQTNLGTLTPPAAAGQTELATARLPDNEIQIGLQPAATSIFQNFALGSDPAALPPANQLVRSAIGEGVTRPLFSSGMVDIASDDLGRIRAVVLDADDYNTVNVVTYTPTDATFTPDAPSALGNANSTTAHMKQWMIGGFPTNSNLPLRMRCEPAPPDYLGVLSGPTQFHNDIQRVDQTMLSASMLAPACTEFIVEWSFGDVMASTNPAYENQTIWHGMIRDQVVNRSTTPQTTAIAAWPYGSPPGALGLVANSALPGLPADAFVQTFLLRNGDRYRRGIEADLVNFNTPGAQYSCFGFLDPSYAPPTSAPTATALNPLTPPPDIADFPDTVAWVWPKLIRITLTLTDPASPDFEQTYQFIFETPEARDGV